MRRWRWRWFLARWWWRWCCGPPCNTRVSKEAGVVPPCPGYGEDNFVGEERDVFLDFSRIDPIPLRAFHLKVGRISDVKGHLAREVYSCSPSFRNE